jgi:hypothetical protein
MKPSASWRSAIAYPSRTTFSLTIMFVVLMVSPAIGCGLDLCGAAIDEQLDAGDVARVVGRQENDTALATSPSVPVRGVDLVAHGAARLPARRQRRLNALGFLDENRRGVRGVLFAVAVTT